ncbi:Hypothetical protein A7982_03679 [Minicystis rosea]|nr:Hypothetical protein A7982_03679 [Minicystis rosea]
MPPNHASVRFDETGTLALAPGSTHVLGVVGEPAAPYAIAFTLLGSPLDGWLDPPVTTAGSTGHAGVELHAPSQATTFHVRASLLDEKGAPGASAERAVAVSDQGFGSIRVEPMYGGHRTVTEWTASVVAGPTCNDLATTLPEEPPGALGATAPAGAVPIIKNAPVGPNLAVVIRAGHFAWGCANTTALTPGGTVTVPVKVIDKALDLTGASLLTTFDFSGAAAALSPLLAAAGALVAETFLPSNGKEGSVILNAMAALVPSSSTAAFSTQRIDKGWDALATAHFSKLAPGLRDRLVLWSSAGLASQSLSLDALLASGNPGPATATVTRFGDVDGAAAGASKSVPLTWSAEPQDKVILSADIGWEPSRFAGNAALAAAQVDVPDAASVSDALVAVADCPGLAYALGSFGTCDAACIEQLCEKAIGTRFGAALDASLKTAALGTLSIKASADATVGDTAQPTGLSGHWLGDLAVGGTSISLSGTLTAPAP